MCQLVESPSNGLRTVAVMKVEIQDDRVGEFVLSCGMGNSNVDVI